jgi:hypothetical protein
LGNLEISGFGFSCVELERFRKKFIFLGAGGWGRGARGFLGEFLVFVVSLWCTERIFGFWGISCHLFVWILVLID